MPSEVQKVLKRLILSRRDPFAKAGNTSDLQKLLARFQKKREERKARRNRNHSRSTRQLSSSKSTTQKAIEGRKKTTKDVKQQLPVGLRQQLNQISFPNLTPSRSKLISTHGGYKIQAGLIIHRVPLQLEEPKWRSEFREFRQEWMETTGNQCQLDPSLIFMKLPHHRYISPEDKALKLRQAGLTEEAIQVETELLPEVERLLLTDGISRDAQGKNDQKNASSNKKSRGRRLLNPDTASVYRAPWDLLTLLVWYPTEGFDGRGESQGRWTFPIADRIHKTSMNKVFYYRAYWKPNGGQIQVKQSSLIRRYAWVRSREASNYLNDEERELLRNASLLN